MHIKDDSDDIIIMIWLLAILSNSCFIKNELILIDSYY